MKKTNVVAILNPEIVERFSQEEMIVLVGGKSVWQAIKDFFGDINIGNCSTTNTNCVTGCACTA